MSPTIEPHAHRAIVGWLIVCRALRRHQKLAYSGDIYASTFLDATNWLSRRCAGEVSLPDDESSTRQLLPKLVDQLERNVMDRLERASADVKDSFAGVVAAIRADVIASENVDDPLVKLDAWAREATEQCYREVAPGIVNRLGGIRTSILHSGSPTAGPSATLPPPNGSIDPWRVSGETIFPAAGPAFEVRLSLGGPDWKSWAAAPYVLLHELLNHGAQGPWSDACRKPDDTDPFAEGWMDVVVYELHQLLALGLQDHVPPLDDSADHRAEAAALFAARRSEREWTYQRRFGINVAEGVHGYLCQRSGQPVDPTFLRLSLDVNASGVTHPDRLRFVGGMKFALDAALEGRRLPDGTTLGDWIAAYENSGDIEAFVDRATELSRAQRESRGQEG